LSIENDYITLEEVMSSLYTKKLHLKASMNDEDMSHSRLVVFNKDKKVKKQR